MIKNSITIKEKQISINSRINMVYRSILYTSRRINDLIIQNNILLATEVIHMAIVVIDKRF